MTCHQTGLDIIGSDNELLRRPMRCAGHLYFGGRDIGGLISGTVKGSTGAVGSSNDVIFEKTLLDLNGTDSKLKDVFSQGYRRGLLLKVTTQIQSGNTSTYGHRLLLNFLVDGIESDGDLYPSLIIDQSEKTLVQNRNYAQTDYIPIYTGGLDNNLVAKVTGKNYGTQDSFDFEMFFSVIGFFA